MRKTKGTFHEPTHPRPLAGGEQAFDLAVSVPLLVCVYRSGGHLACRRAGHPARRDRRVVPEVTSISHIGSGRQDAALYGSQDGRRYGPEPHAKHVPLLGGVRGGFMVLMRDETPWGLSTD